MAIKKSKGPFVWTVAELGSFYTEHRLELLAHAKRILKDTAKAEEIIQDALIKFMLAAPELESNEHALSYLHRTIENLCIDLFRLEGRRPNLVVIDEAQSEVEAAWQVDGDHSLAISAAEDAAIIRQALALLSPAERAALVMWEVEGRSTAEIATALGIKESAVRHTVSRARASLRQVLSEFVIDKKRGLTALDLLSTTYKKSSEFAKKSSKIALSLLIVMVAFLGFNSVTGSEFNSGSVNTSLTQDAPNVSEPSTLPKEASQSNKELSSGKVEQDNSSMNFRTSKTLFAGLSKDGIPSGFTVADSLGNLGSIAIASPSTINNPDGYVLVSYAQSIQSNSLNILMAQSITVDGSGTSYTANPAVTIAKSWFPLTLSGSTSSISRLLNGDYLLISTLYIDSSVDTALFVEATGGLDVESIPNEITTRIILDSGKRSILAQAINVSAKGVN